VIGRELSEVFQHVSVDVSVLGLGRGEMRCEARRATLDVASYPADTKGRRYGTVWVMRDVTAVRRLESIAASVDMMNNLGHVLGTVRHELGNPINAIKTALSVLLERFDSFAEEKKKAYLVRCLDDVARVQALLETLRTFNMFEAVRNERVDLLSFLTSLTGSVKEQLRAQGIACELRLPPGALAVVLADRRALQQVLLGLVSNAVDAVAGRRRPRISFEVEMALDEVRVSVADNGVGVAPGDLGMVFLPLFTTKPQGTGLGLAIARNLVTRMNGTIELRSRVGRGTRVEIVLPRAETAERTA
jgi:signal transduction histidine kinase